ncbi:MAG: hypothetical protein IPL61_38380 [Myxococcales bacterium]|nr:hypothetical protein [Myxococcales bacterium]
MSLFTEKDGVTSEYLIIVALSELLQPLLEGLESHLHGAESFAVTGISDDCHCRLRVPVKLRCNHASDLSILQVAAVELAPVRGFPFAGRQVDIIRIEPGRLWDMRAQHLESRVP